MHVLPLEDGEYFNEPETQGDATIWRGGFKIVDDHNHTVEQCVMAVIEQKGEPVRFEFAAGPTKDYGLEHVVEGKFHGDYAVAFASLVAKAYERLSPHWRAGRPHSDGGAGMSIDIEL